MRRILSYMRRAIDDYNMIDEGDKIAVGVSGGKDSITLLYAMKLLQRFYPKNFDLIGITVDVGFSEFDPDPVYKFCKENDIKYEVNKTEIKDVVFDIRKETNPCSLCSKMRKGALNETAKELGYSKVALGHHFEDAVETFLLCLLYEGRIGCFSPVSYLDRMKVHQIRPLIYVHENEIINTAKRLELPIIKNPCPADGYTKRQDVKELTQKLIKEIPDADKKIFGAMQRSDINGWGMKM